MTKQGIVVLSRWEMICVAMLSAGFTFRQIEEIFHITPSRLRSKSPVNNASSNAAKKMRQAGYHVSSLIDMEKVMLIRPKVWTLDDSRNTKFK